MTDRIGIDEQIADIAYDVSFWRYHQDPLSETDKENLANAEAILASLKELKHIQEAKVPEPALQIWRKHNPTEHLFEWLIAPSAYDSGTKFYGPEVLDLLRRETAKNEWVKELLRESYEVYAGMEGIPIPQTACEAYLLRIIMEMQKPLSAALLAEVEKETGHA